MAKLTKAQRRKLVEIERETLPDGTGRGSYIWDRHEMRVCNTMRNRGLIRICVDFYALITDAGRAALSDGAGDE